MDYRIENCASSATSAVRAQQGGAYRVELCAALPEGGTTPSYGEICTARRLLDIKLNVIIRPRGGDFLYTPIEQEVMLHDIEQAKHIGVDGVVIGCLTPEGEVDRPLMARLIEAAGGMSVTFHRAIDMCRDREAALETIIDLGCSHVLTSGGHNTALEGADELARMVRQAAGRIVIMPGSGVNPTNIAQLAERTGASEFHFSARRPTPSGMLYRHAGVSMGGTVTIDEYSLLETDPELIRSALSALKQLHS